VESYVEGDGAVSVHPDQAVYSIGAKVQVEYHPASGERFVEWRILPESHLAHES